MGKSFGRTRARRLGAAKTWAPTWHNKHAQVEACKRLMNVPESEFVHTSVGFGYHYKSPQLEVRHEHVRALTRNNIK
jgi:hypothetical protein